MSIDWSQIGQAPIFERGNYFKPGKYKLRLLRCLTKQTQQSGEAFITEFEVLESNNPEHQIGSKGTWFIKMASQQQQLMGFSNILEMVAALLGYDIANKDHKDQIDQNLRPQLAGLVVALQEKGTVVLQGHETVAVECRIGPTKRGTDFTFHTWSPWSPAPGWQPAATPVVAQVPQRTAAQPAAAPQGYPSASSGTPPVYAPPAFAPAALAPAPAYAPPAAPQAPAAAGAPPPWMMTPR
jgi:hypothetical protein